MAQCTVRGRRIYFLFFFYLTPLSLSSLLFPSISPQIQIYIHTHIKCRAFLVILSLIRKLNQCLIFLLKSTVEIPSSQAVQLVIASMYFHGCMDRTIVIQLLIGTHCLKFFIIEIFKHIQIQKDQNNRFYHLIFMIVNSGPTLISFFFFNYLQLLASKAQVTHSISLHIQFASKVKANTL